ncbi:MAG: hypothetical protein P0111_04080 [Nitrospira sp.]|nr:hypothetical protein [Nitrospira sp.]
MRLAGMTWIVLVAMLAAPLGGVAGASPTGRHPSSAPQKSGAESSFQEKAAGKADGKEVQSRGLFSKKKKKKLTGGGAAAQSQPSELTDPPVMDR